MKLKMNKFEINLTIINSHFLGLKSYGVNLDQKIAIIRDKLKICVYPLVFNLVVDWDNRN